MSSKSKIGNLVGRKNTPANMPLPGQVKNNAGGFSYQVDSLDLFRRFLILGVFGNTYYLNSQNQAIKHLENIIKIIEQDYTKVLDLITEVSTNGLAQKNDFAIFSLAVVAAKGTPEAKTQAYKLVPKICRTGTHLFQFLEDLKALGKGRGNGLKRAIQRWYQYKTPDNLLYQVLKYRNRNSWSHKDALRCFKPVEKDPLKNSIFRWITKNEWNDEIEMPMILQNFINAQASTNEDEIINLISDSDIPREFIPNQFLNKPKVWEALLKKMPLTALLRNLGNMAKHNLFKDSNNVRIVEAALSQESLHKSRIHPMSIIVAYYQYSLGRGEKSDGVWEVNPRILDALDEAFYKSLKNVNPTGKNILVAMDVSGSMSALSGIGSMSCSQASAVIATMLYNIESNVDILAFTTRTVETDFITKKTSFQEVIKKVSYWNGGTDLACPLVHALHSKTIYDGIVILTDNETWAGNSHAQVEFEKYLTKKNKDCKLVVASMASNQFTVGEPSHPNIRQVVGLDASIITLIQEVISGSM